MFKILTVRDKVRVTPEKFGSDVMESIKQSIQEQIEGKLNQNIGMFLATTEIIDVSEGEILPEDGAIHYTVEFKILAYVPELNEVVLGEVVDAAEFGAFVRIGPFDAMVHVSQMMEDKVSYNEKTFTFVGKKSGKKLQKEDMVRTRVVGVSLGKSGRNKVSLTMRQPCLGTLADIEKGKKTKK
ncbi:MAG: DNA-directed RNA polymerase [Candidatus Aenigmarchaeota archaeon]|nr:DNA-directed RNA polymerase [Candidatus Aenigmarchaeota archaeon]